MPSPQLEIVGAPLPDPPYPPDTRTAGWRFQLDCQRVLQSDTWALAATTPEARPWLLMLWFMAWQEIPAGTLPADDALIAAKMQMPMGLFQTHRDLLMRRWFKAQDGRLYNPTLVREVMGVLKVREATNERVRRHRQAKPGKPKRKPQSPASTRASRLPLDWTLPPEWQQWTVDAYHVDPKEAFRLSIDFRDYWWAKPGNAGCKLDWLATWRRWCRRKYEDQ